MGAFNINKMTRRLQHFTLTRKATGVLALKCLELHVILRGVPSNPSENLPRFIKWRLPCLEHYITSLNWWASLKKLVVRAQKGVLPLAICFIQAFLIALASASKAEIHWVIRTYVFSDRRIILKLDKVALRLTHWRKMNLAVMGYTRNIVCFCLRIWATWLIFNNKAMCLERVNGLYTGCFLMK